MNKYTLLMTLQGYPIREAVHALEELSSLSPEEKIKMQEQHRWDIFNFHCTQNAWYKNRVKDTSIASWTDIPVLMKKDIQVPLEQIVTSSYLPNSFYRNNTSGSTGHPFHFAKDKFAHAMTWAYIFQSYKEFGIEYGGSLQARFFGIPLSKKKYVKEKVKDWLAARVRFPIFDLSDRVLGEYLKKFKSHSFDYLYGYTSSLVLFAKYVHGTGKKLNEICPSLKYCIVTSEVCTDIDRELLEKGFGVPVINEYGAAELDIIAFTNQNGDQVLNEENLFVEILDDNGNPVKPGEVGRVVITSLHNKAMPFIRYDLGDKASIKPERYEGKRIIGSLNGRINDVAILPSGKKSPGLTFYYVSKSLLEQSGVIKEFIIKQLEPDLFHFEYVASSPLSPAQEKEIKDLMDLYLEPGLRATFEKKDQIERTGAGKFKHFQSLLPLRN